MPRISHIIRPIANSKGCGVRIFPAPLTKIQSVIRLTLPTCSLPKRLVDDARRSCCPAQFVSKAPKQTFFGTEFTCLQQTCVTTVDSWCVSRLSCRDELMTLYRHNVPPQNPCWTRFGEPHQHTLPTAHCQHRTRPHYAVRRESILLKVRNGLARLVCLIVCQSSMTALAVST